MNDEKLLRNSSIGTAIAAICCFTPALVILFGFAGLSALVGWLDYGLFPMLFASMGAMAYAFYMRAGRVGPPPILAISVIVIALSALLFWLEFRFALRISIGAAVATAAYVYFLKTRSRRGDTPVAS